jgi:hypothetical protein
MMIRPVEWKKELSLEVLDVGFALLETRSRFSRPSQLTVKDWSLFPLSGLLSLGLSSRW